METKVTHYYNEADIDDLERRQAILANHLGKNLMNVQLIEEASELIKALTKIYRAENGGFVSAPEDILMGNLIEEIGDVQSCINNIMILYNISEDEIYADRDAKLRRAFARYNIED